MIVFVNERSLEQYGDWGGALKLFLSAAQELAPVAPVLFKDSYFFAQGSFIQRFHTLSFPKDLRALILDLVFGNRYYKCWRPNRLSDETDNYTCLAPALALQDESVCEAAEQKLLDATASVSILSASDSSFNNDPITISKISSGAEIELKNAISIETVKQWIAAQRGYYDRGSNFAPKDFQTILQKAPAQFQATGRLERRFSRRIFREIATGRLYYVDEGHPGLSAHLEVFGPNFEHLGTADIDTGELNVVNRVDGRVLKL